MADIAAQVKELEQTRQNIIDSLNSKLSILGSVGGITGFASRVGGVVSGALGSAGATAMGQGNWQRGWNNQIASSVSKFDANATSPSRVLYGVDSNYPQDVQALAKRLAEVNVQLNKFRSMQKQQSVANTVSAVERGFDKISDYDGIITAVNNAIDRFNVSSNMEELIDTATAINTRAKELIAKQAGDK